MALAIPTMRTLPPRTYRPDAALRRDLFTAESVRHPAKGHLELFRDLFRRYTLPGQWVIDPFGGIGGSLVGTILGRHVVLHELEPPFVELARGNWAKLRAYAGARRGEYLPGVPLGQVVILQGDSRRLPFPDGDGASGADCAVTSPPFGAMNAPDAGGKVTQRPNKDGVGFEGGREAFVYSEATPGQIGNLPLGNVAAAIGSPPYADSGFSSHDDFYTRGEDPSGQAHNGRFRGGSLVRDTYQDAANIGRLQHADGVISSPPYADAALQQGREKGARGGDSKRRAKQDYAAYGDPTNIARLEHGPAAVISSPPYADVASRNRSAEPYCLAQDPALKAKYGTGDTNRHIDGYGDSPGQIGAEQGETYASAMLAVLRECYRVVRPGGVCVMVSGNYVRDGRMVDLAADLIALATAAGWTPVERWRHEKSTISFWRRLHARQRPDVPVVTWEDVLVFVKGHQGWPFAELEPTAVRPARVRQETPPTLFDYAETEGAAP